MACCARLEAVWSIEIAEGEVGNVAAFVAEGTVSANGRDKFVRESVGDLRAEGVAVMAEESVEKEAVGEWIGDDRRVVDEASADDWGSPEYTGRKRATDRGDALVYGTNWDALAADPLVGDRRIEEEKNLDGLVPVAAGVVVVVLVAGLGMYLAGVLRGTASSTRSPAGTEGDDGAAVVVLVVFDWLVKVRAEGPNRSSLAMPWRTSSRAASNSDGSNAFAASSGVAVRIAVESAVAALVLETVFAESPVLAEAVFSTGEVGSGSFGEA